MPEPEPGQTTGSVKHEQKPTPVSAAHPPSIADVAVGTRDDLLSTRSHEVLPTGAAAVLPSALPKFPGFEILHELGRGGMGVVYRARDIQRNELVALKTLQRISPAGLYRFKQEFRTLADVTHPNLVGLYELVAAGEQWFFTMELVEGVDFLTFARVGPDAAATEAQESCTLHHDRAGEPDRLRAGIRQLADGLMALHRGGRLHRDIKPSNVLVTASGRVVLLDFGLAAELDELGVHERSGEHVVGTFAYMSPEQGAGLSVSPASDWYSVGVMLYQALAGQLPFTGNVLEMLRNKQTKDAVLPQPLWESIPEDLRTLCAGLLRRQAKERLCGADVLQMLTPHRVEEPSAKASPPILKAQIPLVERERHLEALNAALLRVKEGQSVSFLVHGAPGLGKTSLVRAFLDNLKQREPAAAILFGRCFQQESMPFKAFDILVDSLSQYLAGLAEADTQALLPRGLQALLKLFPVLARVPAIAAAPRRHSEMQDAQELRRRAFTALRELLGRIGDRVPLILCIDDLQWGDLDSAALIDDLMRPPDPPLLLFLGCYRTEDASISPFLREFLGKGREPQSPLVREELVVDALTPGEAVNVALSCLGRINAETRAQAEAIARESGGNPLFLLQLAADIRPGEQSGRTSGGTEAITLEKLLIKRIGRLPGESRRLLEAIAVSARPLPLPVAFQAANVDARERRALTLLRSERLIRSGTSEKGEGLEVYHDRIRETIVSALQAVMLQDCHLRLARALEATGEADPEVLGVHFQGAGQRASAGKYYELAAGRAAATLAFDRAARLCGLALELRPGSEQEQRGLRVQLADALANAGRGAVAAREYLRASAAAPAHQSVDLERRAATQYLISGHIDDGLAAMKSVLEAVGIKLPRTTRGALASFLWGRLKLSLRGLRFRQRAAREIAPEELARLDVCWSAAQGLSIVHPIRGADLNVRHLLLALRAGEPYRIVRGLAMEIGYLALSGGRAAGRIAKIIEYAEGLAGGISDPYAIGLIRLGSGVAALEQGRWKQAQDLTEQAEKILRGTPGTVWELDTAHATRLYALFFQGNWSALRPELAMLLQEAQERGNLYALVHLGMVHRPIIQLTADNPEAAQEELDNLAAQCAQHSFPVLVADRLFAQTVIDLYRGDEEGAKRCVGELKRAMGGSLLMRVQLFRIYFWETHARVWLTGAARGAAPKEALQAAVRYAARIEREGTVWGNAIARSLRAGAAAMGNDREKAAALYADAVMEFERADMHFHAAVCRQRLGGLIGGEQKRLLVEQAASWFRAHAVKNPSRLAQVFAPGR